MAKELNNEEIWLVEYVAQVQELTEEQRSVLKILQELSECRVQPTLKTISNCLEDNPTIECVNATVKELIELGYVALEDKKRRIVLK